MLRAGAVWPGPDHRSRSYVQDHQGGGRRTVAAGHRYISPTLADFLLARHAGAEALRASKPGLNRLTPAERRVLKLIAEGQTTKEIADELGLSPRTVKNHRTNLCAKLDVHGVHGLVKFAYDNKSRL